MSRPSKSQASPRRPPSDKHYFMKRNCSGGSYGLCLCCLVVVIALCHVTSVRAGSRMIEPPTRASLWRYGFGTPVNFDDDEIMCGGYQRQYSKKNGGKCGVCGDPWDATPPRQNEAGHVNTLDPRPVRVYPKGGYIAVAVESSKDLLGHYEFRLCKVTASHVTPDQNCFDQTPLSIRESQLGQTYRIGQSGGLVMLHLDLPTSLTCEHCILQWRHVTGNRMNNGSCVRCSEESKPTCNFCLGCGQQTWYQGCADIAIYDVMGSHPAVRGALSQQELKAQWEKTLREMKQSCGASSAPATTDSGANAINSSNPSPESSTAQFAYSSSSSTITVSTSSPTSSTSSPTSSTSSPSSSSSGTVTAPPTQGSSGPAQSGGSGSGSGSGTTSVSNESTTIAATTTAVVSVGSGSASDTTSTTTTSGSNGVGGGAGGGEEQEGGGEGTSPGTAYSTFTNGHLVTRPDTTTTTSTKPSSSTASGSPSSGAGATSSLSPVYHQSTRPPPPRPATTSPPPPTQPGHAGPGVADTTPVYGPTTAVRPTQSTTPAETNLLKPVTPPPPPIPPILTPTLKPPVSVTDAYRPSNPNVYQPTRPPPPLPPYHLRPTNVDNGINEPRFNSDWLSFFNRPTTVPLTQRPFPWNPPGSPHHHQIQPIKVCYVPFRPPWYVFQAAQWCVRNCPGSGFACNYQTCRPVSCPKPAPYYQERKRRRNNYQMSLLSVLLMNEAFEL